MLGALAWTVGKFLNDNADAIQAVAAVVGAGAASLWAYTAFRRRREHVPHLNVEHRISHYAAGDGHTLLHVTVRVTNVGSVIGVVRTAKVWVQQMLPVPDAILATISRGDDPVTFGASEVSWPLATAVVRNCDWSRNPNEVEPGETEDLHFDFIVPAHVRGVQVYSFLRNHKKRTETGWNTTSICVLSGGLDGQSASSGAAAQGAGTGEAAAGRTNHEEIGDDRGQDDHQAGSAQVHSAPAGIASKAIGD